MQPSPQLDHSDPFPPSGRPVTTVTSTRGAVFAMANPSTATPAGAFRKSGVSSVTTSRSSAAPGGPADKKRASPADKKNHFALVIRCIIAPHLLEAPPGIAMPSHLTPQELFRKRQASVVQARNRHPSSLAGQA